MYASKLPGLLRFVWDHPLSRGHRLDRLWRLAAWQVGSRLAPGPVLVPFVNDTKLLVSPGMHGATGNVYTGLHEFHEMAFVLHALRPGDLFVDVGANIGAYSILAAGAVGAEVVAIEPAESTIDELKANILVNNLERRIELHQVVAGNAAGWAEMTTTLGSMNSVVQATTGHLQRSIGGAIRMESLDQLLGDREPSVIKIDVEGFEPQVLAGARKTLGQTKLRAVLIETNVAVERAANDLEDIDQTLRDCGFEPACYDGVTRRLTKQDVGESPQKNTVYLRDPDGLQARLLSAAKYRVLNKAV